MFLEMGLPICRSIKVPDYYYYFLRECCCWILGLRLLSARVEVRDWATIFPFEETLLRFEKDILPGL